MERRHLLFGLCVSLALLCCRENTPAPAGPARGTPSAVVGETGAGDGAAGKGARGTESPTPDSSIVVIPTSKPAAGEGAAGKVAGGTESPTPDSSIEVIPAPKPAVPEGEEKVRRSVLAGSWYEGDAERLAASVDRYLALGGAPPGHPIALVAPHAGHRYSGGIAGQAYSGLRGRTYGRVFLLGPSHRVPFRGVALPADTHFETPLGRIPVDLATVKALLAEKPFLSHPEAHAEEHSIEIHLPFLQRVLPPFQLVPMVVSGLTDEDVAQVSLVLRRTIRPGDLVIASSDFTHYGPRFDYFGPPDDLIPVDEAKERLHDLMVQAWQLIRAQEGLGLLSHVRRTGDTICGALPIAVLLGVLPPGVQPHRIAMDTSGAITGDYTDSVSYMAAQFSGLWPYTTVDGAGALTDAEKDDLLRLARFTLETVVKEGRKPGAEEAGIVVTDRLRQLSGVFVTLKKEGDLRGCIGNIAPVKPLVDGVIDNAVNAARFDRRFTPVQPDELSAIEVEVSVLTPPRRASGVQDIILGRHGVILEKGDSSAVFLPQVAPEQGWTVADTLTHLSTKAGLPPDAWREGADFELFEAIVFHEGR
ncbi:MAG: AmmeMemoRadiSam system protein B [Deltaproteobacteria bacterium]|nr:AmmeMemoRadiSam system protein B [Deltaproteobacteria bacterium]